MKPEDLQEHQKPEELEFDQLIELVLELPKAVQSQNDLIDKLRSQLDQDSQTSSKPPLKRPAQASRDSPEQQKPRVARRPTGKGGDPGDSPAIEGQPGKASVE